MVKFRLIDTIGLGLSNENIVQLKRGNPILFNMKNLSVENKIMMIFFGNINSYFKNKAVDVVKNEQGLLCFISIGGKVKTLGFSLSSKHIKYMKKGRIITIKERLLDLPVKLLVFIGKTEKAMQEMILKL